ncbi:MAG TPA: DUF2760 domain-containing protein [Polyangiaceae bacterium]|nr:DUF2760 domain-containing protein [Polyangiaceae bacterium]
MTDAPISFFARLWLALVCALRVVFDPRLAVRVNALVAAREAPESEPATAVVVPPAPSVVPPTPATTGSKPPMETEPADALGLLALLQREGRLVDFLKQEIDSFGDADVGGAARVVHAGCRKALLGHFDLSRIRTEAEGTTITVPEGFDGRSVKLTGNVQGSAPYRGVLRHGGWRVEAVRLPTLVAGYDATIIAPAEIEL